MGRISSNHFLRNVHNSRQPDREGRSTTRLARDGNVAPHHLAKALADSQAKARAAVFPRRRCVGLRELLEQLVYLLRRHADARIGDRDGNPVAAVFLSLPRIDRDGAALRKYWRCS